MSYELAVAWNPWVGIPLAVVGVIVLLLVWLFGEPRKEQGKRRVAPEPNLERREPTLGDSIDENDAFGGDERMDPLFREPEPQQGELDVNLRNELEKLGAALADQRHETVTMPKATEAKTTHVEIS